MGKRIALIVVILGVMGIWVYGIYLAEKSRPVGDGYTWYRTSPGDGSYGGNIVVIPNGCVFASANGNGGKVRVLRSTDGGKNWNPIGRGINNCWINGFAANSEGVLFAATGRGIYRSRNNGSSWSLSNNGLTLLGVGAVGVDPKDRLYAFACDSGERQALYRSDNDGDSWRKINESLPRGVYRIVSNSKGVLYCGTEYEGVYRSSDSGANWKQVLRTRGDDYSLVRSLAIDSRDRIFAADSYSIYSSNDDGKRWKKLTAGKEKLRWSSVAVTGSGEIIGGTSKGAYISKDDGVNWHPLELGRGLMPFIIKPYIPNITVDKEGRIYANCGNDGIYSGVPNKIENAQN